MKKILAVVLGFLSTPGISLANYEACQAHLSTKFSIDKSTAGEICAIDSRFMQQCMDERSELLNLTDFQALAEICTDLLNQKQKRERQQGLQSLRINPF